MKYYYNKKTGTFEEPCGSSGCGYCYGKSNNNCRENFDMDDFQSSIVVNMLGNEAPTIDDNFQFIEKLKNEDPKNIVVFMDFDNPLFDLIGIYDDLHDRYDMFPCPLLFQYLEKEEVWECLQQVEFVVNKNALAICRQWGCEITSLTSDGQGKHIIDKLFFLRKGKKIKNSYGDKFSTSRLSKGYLGYIVIDVPCIDDVNVINAQEKFINEFFLEDNTITGKKERSEDGKYEYVI